MRLFTLSHNSLLWKDIILWLFNIGQRRIVYYCPKFLSANQATARFLSRHFFVLFKLQTVSRCILDECTIYTIPFHKAPTSLDGFTQRSIIFLWTAAVSLRVRPFESWHCPLNYLNNEITALLSERCGVRLRGADRRQIRIAVQGRSRARLWVIVLSSATFAVTLMEYAADW